MRSVSVIFLITAISPIVWGQINFKQISWEDALAESGQTNKPIFLYGYSQECEPCLLLEEYTFEDEEVANYFNDQFINLPMDMEEYPGIELAEVYDVILYPTMLFFDGDGNIIHRGCGSMNAKEFLELGKAVFTDAALSKYDSLFKAGERDLNSLMEYIDLQEEVCLDAEGFVQKMMDEIPEKELLTDHAFTLIENYQWNIFSREFQYLLENKRLFEDSIDQERVHNKLYNTFLAQYEEIFESEDVQLFALRALRNEMQPLKFSGADTLAVMINLYYYELMEDWESFSDNAIEWVGMSGTLDSEELDDLAWKFYLYVDNKRKLEIAANWAKQSVDVEPTPSAIDTYASLLFKLGDKKTAIELEKQAIAMAEELLEETSHFEHQLKKFTRN